MTLGVLERICTRLRHRCPHPSMFRQATVLSAIASLHRYSARIRACTQCCQQVKLLMNVLTISRCYSAAVRIERGNKVRNPERTIGRCSHAWFSHGLRGCGVHLAFQRRFVIFPSLWFPCGRRFFEKEGRPMEPSQRDYPPPALGASCWVAWQPRRDSASRIYRRTGAPPMSSIVVSESRKTSLSARTTLRRGGREGG